MNTKSLWRRMVLLGAVAGALVLPAGSSVLARDGAGQPQVQGDRGSSAMSQALQAEALAAIRQGQWSKTSELIEKAASMSGDPVVAQMSQWIAQFEAQRQTFAAERNKAYEEAVVDVRKLSDAGQSAFAIAAAVHAYVLAEDKDAFVQQDWVRELINNTASLADASVESAEWVRARRLYSDLAAIEPLNPKWKDQVKNVTRRLRILAMYSPETLKKQVETESKIREQADRILKPTTQPTTKPVAEANDTFKIVWQDTVKGIESDMLRDALKNARRHYWRYVTYQDLLTGGLESMRAVATTPGVEEAFPAISDPTKREAFVAAVNDLIESVKQSPRPNDDSLMSTTLAILWQQNQRTINLPEEVFVNEFADGAFSKLDDFTGMIWPYDVEEFNKSTQGEFQGVGISIDTDDDGNLVVVSPLEDTPAYRLGIKAGDIVTHINGKNAKGISIPQAVKNITGPAGTTVQLTIRSTDGEVKTYEIRRETIKVASIKGWERRGSNGWDYLIDHDQRIGYIRLTNFTKTTADELRAALSQLRSENARAIILDLRSNPGGLLNAATEVCDRFLSGGDIVSTRSDREQVGAPPIVARTDKDDVNVPMVVLVNQYSASASEIVSGALRDQKRALIVGERTFGKGSVQMLFQVDGRSAFLKLTTSHYYLPNGECIHREDNSPTWGVEPDVTVSMTNEQMSKSIKLRREHDVLRDPTALAEAARTPTTQPVTSADVLNGDPQLSAAVLLLRLQLAGAKI